MNDNSSSEQAGISEYLPLILIEADFNSVGFDGTS